MRNSKKGSISVFLVFILAAMIGLTAVFIYASKQKAYTGISDGALNLAMRSILSEYNLALYERYGLLGFEKSGMETSLEINDYVDYTFNGKAPVKKTQVNFGEYSLGNPEVLKQQIIEHMNYESATGGAFKGESDQPRTEYNDRTLRNKSVINTLPSEPFADGGTGFIERMEELKDQIKSVNGILSGVSETYLLDSYIMNHFKYATGGPLYESSFFDHEVEYILSGNYSNAKNRENVESAMKIIRIALNTAYLYSDSERYAQTLTAAEILTPASAPATQAALITAWANAEANNDIKLLLKGRPVPLNKTDASWATSLENVINNVSEGIIDTGTDSGLYYSDYLKVMLHFQNEKVKLARTADLIQINMKAVQDRDFLLKTCNEGMYMNTEIYGKEYSYETRY